MKLLDALQQKKAAFVNNALIIVINVLTMIQIYFNVKNAKQDSMKLMADVYLNVIMDIMLIIMK